MRFFVDNNLAPALARVLNALAVYEGYQVFHLKDRFDRATPDEIWLRKLGTSGDWVILSGDLRITRNPHEKRIWRQSGLTAFFLAKGWINEGFYEQAWKLVRWWPRIIEQVKNNEPGIGFVIPHRATGRFKLI